MNELAEQANLKLDDLPDEVFIPLEEFAELIVRETIKQMAIQMDEFGDDQSNNPVWYKSEKAVKKHFGIEGE